jgi:flagellar motor switch/type III secretory pathway protein FliN
VGTALQVEPPSEIDSPPAAAAAGSPRLQELVPWLRCTLALEVPVVRFTVRSLLELAPGTILETSVHQSMDIPLRVNGLLMAWTEFEVIGDRLAARITDLT